jgi:DNA-binding transcriptional LysR family regulator
MDVSKLNWDNLRLFLAMARFQSAQETARQLAIDHSTLTRRMHRLEKELETKLFDRTSTGHRLTIAGNRLLEKVEKMESAVVQIDQQVGGDSKTVTGQVRIGATEGFGSYFLAPHFARIGDRYPALSVELVTVPRFINLSKREADLAVNIERPTGSSEVTCKLTDYRLRLYGAKRYLSEHPPIRSISELSQHRFIGYVDELCFSEELRYLESVVPNASLPLRSTNVVAQYLAACQGRGLAILPHFLAVHCSDLQPLLVDEVDIVRSFWLSTPAERKDVARVRAVWDYTREIAELNKAFLMGDRSTIQWPNV